MPSLTRTRHSRCRLLNRLPVTLLTPAGTAASAGCYGLLQSRRRALDFNLAVSTALRPPVRRPHDCVQCSPFLRADAPRSRLRPMRVFSDTFLSSAVWQPVKSTDEAESPLTARYGGKCPIAAHYRTPPHASGGAAFSQRPPPRRPPTTGSKLIRSRRWLSRRPRLRRCDRNCRSCDHNQRAGLRICDPIRRDWGAHDGSNESWL